MSWWTPDRINAPCTLIYTSPLDPRGKKNADLEPVQTKWISSLAHAYLSRYRDRSLFLSRYKPLSSPRFSLFSLIAHIGAMETSCIFHFAIPQHFCEFFPTTSSRYVPWRVRILEMVLRNGITRREHLLVASFRSELVSIVIEMPRDTDGIIEPEAQYRSI